MKNKKRSKKRNWKKDKEKMIKILKGYEDEIRELFENCVLIYLDIFNLSENVKEKDEIIPKGRMYEVPELVMALEYVIMKFKEYIAKRGVYEVRCGEEEEDREKDYVWGERCEECGKECLSREKQEECYGNA